MRSGSKPLGVMSDPRVCRGSVVARQRGEADRVTRELAHQEAEERYRMEVVRNRLSIAINSSSEPSPSAPRHYQASATSSAIRADTNARLSRLTGKTGKAAIAEWSTSTGTNRGEDIDSTSTTSFAKRTRHTPAIPAATTSTSAHRRLQPIKGPSKQHFVNGRKLRENTLPESRPSIGTLRNVRFEPLHNAGREQISGGPHKVVPTLLPATTSKGQHTVSTPSSTLTSRHSRTDTSSTTRRIHRLNLPGTPPQSPYGPVTFSETGIQTDDCFDETFDPLIRQMACSAIQQAIKNLNDEDDLKHLTHQNEKLLHIVVNEKRVNNNLNKTIRRHIKTEQELEKERRHAIKQLKSLDCREVAASIVDDLIDKCLNNLSNRGLIEDVSKYRSVALDTRQLEKERRELKAATLEIEQDFFPYVYAKAEQIFVHKLADSYLRDALFSKDQKNRAIARTKLNEQIQKYQQITKGIKLSNYHQLISFDE